MTVDNLESSISNLESKVKFAQSKSVADNGYGTERHGSTGDHRIQEQSEERIEHAARNWHSEHVVDKCKKQILADIPNCAPAEIASAHHSAQISFEESYAGTLNRDIGPRTHSDPNVRLSKSRSVVDAVPCHCHNLSETATALPPPPSAPVTLQLHGINSELTATIFCCFIVSGQHHQMDSLFMKP
jgi:hypothetical protein